MTDQPELQRALEIEFAFAGHYLRQIWRVDNVAVFARSRSPEVAPHELELVIIKIEPEKKMPNGDIVPAHETYPSASKWGRVGWSFPVRYKERVLSLAEKLLTVQEARADFVRRTTHELWRGGDQ